LGRLDGGGRRTPGVARTTSSFATARVYPIKFRTPRIEIHSVMLVAKMVPYVCIILTPMPGLP
jgi:hypothetical protein